MRSLLGLMGAMMAQRFKAKPYQRDAVAFLVQNKRCALWAEMGMGKTATTLTALDNLSIIEPVFPALVLAPFRVANETWAYEHLKWEHLEHLRVQKLTGLAPEDRTEALRDRHQVYTINYDLLPWLVGLFGTKWPFKTIVGDEATRLKSFRLGGGGQRAGFLGAVVHNGFDNRFIQLSGTPSPNGIKDLWGQVWFLDQGLRLGRSYEAFKKRWFMPNWNGHGITPLPGAEEDIMSRIKDICFSIKAEDHFDLLKPVEVPVYVDLPAGVVLKYREMETKMFMELEGHEVEAVNAASKTMKCLQIASGAAYVDPLQEEDQGNEIGYYVLHDEKIEALKSIIEETNGAPLLVAYHFNSDLHRLKKAFPKGRHLDKKAETIRDWNDGKIQLLFAHPASAGHGLNLQDGGHRIVFFTHNWNLEEHEQIIGRIGPTRQAQAGYKRPVFIYRIITRNTIEEQILERLKTKKSVQDILMEAMTRRKV